MPTFATSSFADSAPVQLDSGKLQNNRVLIPLRAVSENLGADVQWNHNI
ncbi:stalk domain-containing protein [Paenibacillus alginolyticus]